MPWPWPARPPMADAVDVAAEISAEWTERGIAASRAALTGPGALVCEGCGAPIPDARRAANPNARRCVRCQQMMEKRA
jgi:phage/conjugal plasmid C-4 type zinc finger TraR family protein